MEFYYSAVTNGVNCTNPISWNNGANNYKLTFTSKIIQSEQNGVWSAATTWFGEVIPTTDYSVRLTNQVNVDASQTVRDIQIKTGGLLTVNAGKALTISNSLNNLLDASKMVIQSNATETGSLITNGTVSGNVTVERYVGGYSGNSAAWHLLSSPVVDQAITAFDGVGGSDDFYYWDEDQNLWINRTTLGGFLNGDFETTFTEGKGYLVAYSGNTGKGFSGVLNNSDITWTDLSADHGRWHLLGNPFASAIDYNAGNLAITDFSTPQIFDNGTYRPISTVGNIIPAMQGFFVQAVDNTNSITLLKSARVHNFAHNWYKSDLQIPNSIYFKLANSESILRDFLLIGFNENATNGYDIDFDSHKLLGLPEVPQFYAMDSNNEPYSLNIIPTSSTTKEIPIHLRLPSSGDFIISVEYNTIEFDTEIYLEDLLEGNMIDLSTTTSYTFSGEEGINENRFKLHFGATGIDNAPIAAKWLVYASGQQLFVSGENGQTEVSVYNTQGQQVMLKKIEIQGEVRLPLNLSTGVYLVTINNGRNVETTKIIIK